MLCDPTKMTIKIKKFKQNSGKVLGYLFNILHAHLLLSQLELPLGDEAVLIPVHGVEGELAMDVQVQEVPAEEELCRLLEKCG